MAILSPSVLSADFSQLLCDINKAREGGAEFMHIDVMDGAFVPNISFGAPIVKSLAAKTDVPMDVHLMIENPDQRIPDFAVSNVKYICVHQEASRHLNRSLQLIKSLGIKAGVAINPSTPVSALEYVLEYTDLVLVMGVNPGFSGQKLIPNTLEKIKELYRIRKNNNYNYIIEFDGGANLSNAKQLVDAGTDMLVAGSAVFSSDDIAQSCRKFMEIIG